MPISDGAPSSITYTDRSSTIAVAGQAQSLAPANASRKVFWLQNLSTGDLWVSEVGTAAAASPSINVPAGSVLSWKLGEAPATALSVFGAAISQVFAAREG